MPINASIPMSYRPNVALQMRDPLADAERVQSLQARQSQMKQLQQDRQEMQMLQKQLQAAGRDPDLGKLFDVLIQSGRPELVTKGIEGRRKLKEQRDFEAFLNGGQAPAAAAPAAAPAAQPMMPGANGTQIGRVAPQSAVMGRPLGAPGTTPPPTNAMAMAPAQAPVNALASQPAGMRFDQAKIVNALSSPNPMIRQWGEGQMKMMEAQQKMAPKAPTLADRFVPVGNAVFDRQTQRYITKPVSEAPAAAPAAPAAPAPQVPKVALEKGEVYNPETQRIEAVPGSQRYINQSKEHAKSLSTVKTVGQKTKSTMDKIDYILAPDQKDAFAYNFGGYPEKFAGQYFPGGASDLRKKIDSLRSNLKMAGLELIRQGGSIGQMTEREWPIVEQMLAALDSVQSEEDARATLGLIKEQLAKIQRNANDIYTAQWGQTQYFKKPPTAAAKTPEKAAPSAADQIPGDMSNAPAAAPMYARNPSTGERIMSTDGGQTWRPAE